MIDPVHLWVPGGEKAAATGWLEPPTEPESTGIPLFFALSDPLPPSLPLVTCQLQAPWNVAPNWLADLFSALRTDAQPPRQTSTLASL